MDIFADFQGRMAALIEALSKAGKLPGGFDLSAITVEAPRDPAHGDLASNAAMVLARPAAMPPRDIAALIGEGLGADGDVDAVEIAGPGFINIRLNPGYLARVVPAVLEAGLDYGHSAMGAGEKVNVEYVSVNPTGPLHVGHCRGAVFGDALASLLEATGHEVTREYYINDAGAQVDQLARSAYQRYLEALGEDIGEIPSGLYPGEYLVPVGKKLAAAHGAGLKAMDEAEWLPIIRDETVAAMMGTIRSDLAALDISHDVFFSERSMTAGKTDRIAETIADLRAQGLIYEGRLPPPKGKPPEDWEDREQTLFRATEFGDDMDRPLLKSDGSYTYFAADIAYHRDKFKRGFLNQIDMWGADHSGYIKRMQAAVTAISGGKAALDVKICQLVRLFRSGEPVKMSKRSGDFVTLREFVDEVGPGPARFTMLTRKNDAPLDFDFAKVMEQSRENPVFYVQYAHARACSVLRNAGAENDGMDLSDEALSRADPSRLTDEAELTLIRHIGAFPKLLDSAARAHEPHRIAFFVHELASAFHSLWNKGKESPQLRFISADLDVTLSRLALVRAAGLVIAGGLRLLGVEAIEEMR